MLDHMTFRVGDMARSRAFYAGALAPLGYTPCFEERFGDTLIFGLGHADPAVPGGTKIDTWLMQGPSQHGGPAVTSGCHLCWAAPDRATVDAFHAAALAAGGTDNGAPGLRPHYHAHYYGAFVLDPDGNNIEAVCHAPA
ncbi:MAG: VOC family protein [Burkholderiaceae bacterium]|jgi:catechol 2,3-dioxygenase-like lactoylglutathione lyase family enzyme|nr:VOC family protein [Burkholderiaceae bacterium]